MFLGPDYHSLGEDDGHAMVLQEVQPQQSFIADVGNQHRVVNVSSLQVDIQGC